jgi:hypothetical protein
MRLLVYPMLTLDSASPIIRIKYLISKSTYEDNEMFSSEIPKPAGCLVSVMPAAHLTGVGQESCVAAIETNLFHSDPTPSPRMHKGPSWDALDPICLLFPSFLFFYLFIYSFADYFVPVFLLVSLFLSSSLSGLTVWFLFFHSFS